MLLLGSDMFMHSLVALLRILSAWRNISKVTAAFPEGESPPMPDVDNFDAGQVVLVPRAGTTGDWSLGALDV